MRAGIIGGGMIARVHAHAVRASGHEVLAAASRDAASGQRAGQQTGAREVHSTPLELIEDPRVEVVHICSPNDTHPDLVRAALEAGKHVICEKPLATGRADAQAMVDHWRATDLVATVPFGYRFYSSIRELRARLSSGEDTPHLVRGNYLQDWLSRPTDTNWRVDSAQGGQSRAFADIGVHWCDLLEFITGQRITSLTADLSTVYDTRGTSPEPVSTEDAAVLVFRLDGGALGSATISQAAPGHKNDLRIAVDTPVHSYEFHQEEPNTLWIGGREQTRIWNRADEDASPLSTAYDQSPGGHPQGWRDAFTSFVADTYRAAQGEEVDGLPTFDDGLRAAVLTDAVLTSAASGRWVDIN
ncbi:Gfo/Idh/MocA family protein [Kocuria rosea]|uniref:Gfo/Idh/MocA family protein n=1 Tax=Kocuria rosea TaxID=1275 RepID=UPI001C92EF13|nr:Gfo/Idh/MocA family oxidoreductase [Kocuria rosea]WJZ66954.1 Gfo/Idh/MocA family oxidoreductase [Kocuria rosea]